VSNSVQSRLHAHLPIRFDFFIAVGSWRRSTNV
jgi:hypothetical protein